MTTRRTFLKYSALSIGAFAVGPEFGAFAADVRPLIEGVAQACRRLAPLGWGEMLKDATGGQLDIAAADLKDELNKPLAIDRTYPGFGDFALSATRAVEPGIPDRSLLYQRSLRPPSLRTGRVSILEDSRLWRRGPRHGLSLRSRRRIRGFWAPRPRRGCVGHRAQGAWRGG